MRFLLEPASWCDRSGVITVAGERSNGSLVEVAEGAQSIDRLLCESWSGLSN